MKKIGINKTALTGIICLLALIIIAPAAFSANVNPGDPMPDISLKLVDGGEVSIIKAIGMGKGALIFFNTSCNQCQNEIRWALSTYPEGNIHLIGIDMRGERVLKRYKDGPLAKFNAEKMYVDAEFKLPTQLGLTVTPAIALVKEGKLVKTLVGYDDKIKAEVEAFFK